MTTKKSFLDRLSIPSPCSTNWNELVGDDRKRYCGQCAKIVYDFSKLTTTEVLALLTTLRGDVCARITRQPDGTMLTEKSLPVLPIMRPRASPLASVAVTAMITITASPAGRPPAQTIRVLQSNVASEKRNPDEVPQIGEATASIRGTVLDQAGALITGAKVSLIEEASGETRIFRSSDEGKFEFIGLREGTFTVRVEYTGFVTSVTQGVKLASGREQLVDVTMEVGRVVSVTGGVIALVPKPLRVLYGESDLVVVARIGDSKVVERERDARLVRTVLQVSSVLKGVSRRPTVHLYHWNYGDLEGPFSVGDEMLLFLKQSKPQPGHKPHGGYELDDTRWGAKKIAGTELKSYLDRIGELAQIIPEQGPTHAALVEWLVRCAEDPATRWEGAYEFAASIERYSEPEAEQDTDADEDKKTESDAPPSSDNVASNKETVIEAQTPALEDAEQEPNFAAMLTGEQKARLMTALFQTEKVLEGDFQLIELAKHWKDPRLLPFLINQLRKLESEPPRSAESLMDCIVDILDDKEISGLDEEYRDSVSYPEEEHGKESADATAASAEHTQEVKEAIRSRSEALGKFLRAVELVMEKRAK